MSLLVLLGAACSTADGLDTGGWGTGGSEPSDPSDPSDPDPGDEGADGEPESEPEPPEYGHDCGNVALGWETQCYAWGTSRSYTDPVEDAAIEIENEIGDFGPLCCEGNPSHEEADAECTVLCIQQLCNEARTAHMWWTVALAPGCEYGSDPWCGFDMDACLAGEVHSQFVDDPDDDLDPVEYFLDVDCTATNESPRDFGPGTEFDWIQFPNMPDDDPPMCAPAAEMIGSPDTIRSSFALSDTEGTQASFAWKFGESGSVVASDAISVDLGYQLVPCGDPTGVCIEFAALEVGVENFTAEGIVIERADLSLEEGPSVPIEVVAGRFTIPDHALRFLLSGSVEGLPILLSGYNQGAAYGRISGTGVAIKGLHMGYEDPLFAADLNLTIVSSFDASKPQSKISVISEPTDCEEPVVFQASTADPDGGPMIHQWWLPYEQMGSGVDFGAVLPEGTHSVVLITTDASGRTHTTAMSFDRVCG